MSGGEWFLMVRSQSMKPADEVKGFDIYRWISVVLPVSLFSFSDENHHLC